jgi:hypothetical protein
MPIALETWLAPIRREYLETFIPDGGGAVRFVVADDATRPALHARLAAAAADAGLSMIRIDTATTRLHMLHFVFFAITKELDWENLVQTRLESLVADAGYRWPQPGRRTSLASLAEANAVAPPLLRTTLQQHITRAVWEDGRLAQDFRKAMIALLDARLADDKDALRDGVLDWLGGELRSLKSVRDAQIGARIGRHNARAMLMSLCHWLRSCGHRGLVLLLDIRRLTRERREILEGVAYSTAAVMDCYEVLRQVIDDCEHFEGLFLVAVGDARLINDDAPKRALTQYTALKMRVWDDVRPLEQDNPLSPLVVIAP